MRTRRVFVVLLSLAFGLSGCDDGRRFTKTPDAITFDSNAWKDPKSLNGDMRQRMVYDLTQNHLPLGISEKEIIQLLGAPEQMFQDSKVMRPCKEHGRVWFYSMGGELPPDAFDCCYLVLELDSQGRLVEIERFVN